MIENTVGKEEIARYEQFLLFPQCFQRLLLQTRKNQGLLGKGLTDSAADVAGSNLKPRPDGSVVSVSDS